MKKVAIIGSGIAGMASAYHLNKKYDITVFEKRNYAGGHTHTHVLNEKDKEVPVDMGFIVFNHETYPNLLELFAELDVPYENSDMSFSVQHLPSKLEYSGSGMKGLFAQRRNYFNPKHYRLLSEIHKFNQSALEVLSNHAYEHQSISQYFKEKGYSDDLLFKYLIPMTSSIWSTPSRKALDFPIATLVRFAKNHGLLGYNTHFQWKTVTGGSHQYRNKLVASYADKIKLDEEVIGVHQGRSSATVTTEKGKYTFDLVLIAAHADQALLMLDNPTELQRSLLSPFKYQANDVVLHTDESIMPKSRRAWASWNYAIKTDISDQPPFLTYWMNRLQNLNSQTNYFVTLNGTDQIAPSKIVKQVQFLHPLFDKQAIDAQAHLQQLNSGASPLFFCGSYFRYGFHEDALSSGLAAVKAINSHKELDTIAVATL